MGFCWKIVCRVLNLETFFVRKEKEGGGWGKEADAGLLDLGSSGDSPLQGAGLIIGRLLFFFYVTYFPDGFPCVSLMPRSFDILEPGRKSRQTCITQKRKEPGCLMVGLSREEETKQVRGWE